MTTVSDRLALLEGWFPPGWAEPWDNPGLQVGAEDWAADLVLCALDPTAAVIEEAAASGRGLVVAHHPLIFEPLSRVVPSEPVGAAVAAALSGGVAVVACHTNADAANPGVSDALAESLGLDSDGSLLDGPAGSAGIGRVALADGEPCSSWIDRCRERLGGSPRLAGDPAQEARRIAVCAGSGAFAIPAALSLGADLLITGDVKHHAALEALGAGLNVIDAGHHATEWPFVTALAARLAAAGVDAIVSRVNTDPFEGESR